MRTTLIIDDKLMRKIKAMAAQRGETLTSVIDGLLRRGLQAAREPQQPLEPLPTFSMGRMLVDVADRDALYDVMEDRVRR